MMVIGIGFSLAGFILVLILKVDIMVGMKDPMAHLVVSYSGVPIFSTVYNFIVDSPFKLPLVTVIGAIPTIIIGFVVCRHNGKVISKKRRSDRSPFLSV